MKNGGVREIIIACSDVFDKDERYSLSDSVIYGAIQTFAGHATLQAVLPKVLIINSFYGTQIYDTSAMARHIVGIGLDGRLEAGDYSVIENIRHGHGIVTSKSNKEIDFYSFATKYAALHHPEKYPLFDNLVARLLVWLNRRMGFYRAFTQAELRDFGTHISVINALVDCTGLGDYRYKKYDQGLWVWAKYMYQRGSLTEEEIGRIGKSEVG